MRRNVLGIIAVALLSVGCDSEQNNKKADSLNEELCINSNQKELDKVIPEEFRFDCTMLRSAHFSKKAKERSDRITREAMSKYSARSMPRAGQNPDKMQTKREWDLEMFDKLQGNEQSSKN